MENLTFHIGQDGDFVNPEIIDKFFSDVGDKEKFRDIKGNAYGEFYNFVGFIIKGNDCLVTFPKKFMNREKRKDLLSHAEDRHRYIRLLFDSVKKGVKKESGKRESDQYVGLMDDFDSFYPLTQYFRVKSYYDEYGLFTDDTLVKFYGYSGKVAWSDTIRKSPIVVDDGNLLYMPMVIQKNVQEHVFLSKCMAYVIDTTLRKFELFIDGRPTGFDTSDLNFEANDFVLAKLYQIKSSFFKNIHVRLINDLIEFFECEHHEGGDLKLKIYNFNLLWEDMVNEFLNDRFVGVDENQNLVFGSNRVPKKFDKAQIYPDVIGRKGYRLEPDHYLEDAGRRYIFDAKYYMKDDELNYKQVAYYFLLKHHLMQPFDGFDPNATHIPTFNSLILPSTSRSNRTEPHFAINPDYNRDDPDFKIVTQYLNTIEVMENYLGV